MQQEMKYIYQVYTDGSFSRAAEHLYLTQPALSIAVQKVEESIGMPLFDRSRRPLQLTAAGEIYIGTIKKIMGLEQDLDRQIQDIPLFGDALTKHDVKLRLLKGRRDLVLNHLHLGPVTDHVTAHFQSLRFSDLHADRRIELQRPASGGSLRVAEHHTDLLTHLIDKDDAAVGLADNTGQLS